MEGHLSRLVTATTNIILFFCLLLLLVVAAFGQVLPPPDEGNAIVQYRSPGFTYQHDLRGNSAMLYDLGNGVTAYTSQDPNGKIVSQGYLFDAITSPRPLYNESREFLRPPSPPPPLTPR